MGDGLREKGIVSIDWGEKHREKNRGYLLEVVLFSRVEFDELGF